MAVGGRKQILVLGGGFAGMFAARELRRHVGRVADIELINEVNYFTFQPLLPEVAAGGISVRDAVAPLRRLLPGVRVRQAQIYAIDLERKIVTIFQGLQRRYTEVGYDHLVLALGQGVDLSRIPGLAAHALTDEDAERRADPAQRRHRQARARRHHRPAGGQEGAPDLHRHRRRLLGRRDRGRDDGADRAVAGLLPQHPAGARSASSSSSLPTGCSASCRPPSASTPGASSRSAASRSCSGPASARRPAPRSSPRRRGDRHPDLGRHHRQRTVAARRQARRCRTSAGGSGPTAPCASRAATTSGRSATPR